MSGEKKTQTMKAATAAKKLGIYLPAAPEEFRDREISRTELDEYTYLDEKGSPFKVNTRDVVEVRPLRTSIMPAGLADRLTDRENAAQADGHCQVVRPCQEVEALATYVTSEGPGTVPRRGPGALSVAPASRPFAAATIAAIYESTSSN